ncbi:MAG: T9SS type A sorting domain-containing protein [Flavobacteriaceae bacterium]|nr:T9SS type A sorting domain-containing protein [Flavobacteriaceae bacterium]
MKKNYFLILLLTLCFSLFSFGQDLIITGVVDGSLSGGTPKALELYVVNNISDLSIYGVESVTNGNASGNAPEFTFPADQVTAGTFIYIESVSGTNPTAFNDFFGFNSTYQDGVLSVNGDDPIKLYMNGTAIDVFGSVGTDGTGETWEYMDGWAYRKDGKTANTTFTDSDWTYSGPNALDNQSTNASASIPFPAGTYSMTASTNPNLAITSPSINEVFQSVTEVSVSIDVNNFTVSGDGGGGVSDNSGDGYIKSTFETQGGSTENSNFFTTTLPNITVAAGNTYTLTLELVDNSGNSLSTPVTQSVTFSVIFPCDIQLATILTTCETSTSGTDTYTTSIDFTAGNTTTYTITAKDSNNNDVGTIGGDNPSTSASGTITITGVPEGTDFTVKVIGGTGSSCDLTRNISSPTCFPLPIFEDFSYADGSLTNNPLWNGFSGTSGDLLVESGQAVVQHGTPSEDAQIQFESVSGNIYYALDFTVVDPGNPIPGTDNEYFALFKDSGFGYVGRLDIVPPTSSGDFSVGIASDGSTADSVWATDLSYGVKYRATVKYDQVNDIAQLWIDATLETDTSILGADLEDPGRTVIAFALRQSDSDLNEKILVDNLKIGTTFSETTLSSSDIEIQGFAIYPNPVTNGRLSITSNSSDNKQVSIFNVLGKNVLNTIISGTKAEVNTSGISAGIYILKVVEGGKTATSKLIIR